MKYGLKKMISAAAYKGFFNWMPDKAFLKLIYWARMGKPLNLKSPKTYTEKIQWLKLNDRNPLYTKLVDKYEVKAYIAEKIGEQYVIPTLGVWDRFEDIDFEELPERFVLKCTHDSGGLVICDDRSKLNMDQVQKRIEKSLKYQYYYLGREWPYKYVKPRIIAEEYMEDPTYHELRDYKFFCFDGKVRALFIATDRQKENEDTKFDFFDENYQHLNLKNGHPNASSIPQKPKCFEEMKQLAEQLSVSIPQVRVDFYEVDGKVYFGEMTFSHWSGMVPFDPSEWDDVWGTWIDLSKVNR